VTDAVPAPSTRPVPGGAGGRPRLQLRAAGDPLLAPTIDLAVARGHVLAARGGHEEHEGHRERILDLIDTHPGVLARTCQPGHLTGSGMVVDPVDRRFLLMLHAKLRRWFQPGGHADGDGALPGVALREASEETGIGGLAVATPAIDLDVHRVGPPHGPHLHLDVRYLVVAPPGARPRRNHEALDLRWAAIDELAGFGVDAGTVRLARRALDALDELVAQGAVPPA
jgi:8-oxo-dGTP pyrophosphatase MutT (NUDIX family)